MSGVGNRRAQTPTHIAPPLPYDVAAWKVELHESTVVVTDPGVYVRKIDEIKARSEICHLGKSYQDAQRFVGMINMDAAFSPPPTPAKKVV